MAEMIQEFEKYIRYELNYSAHTVSAYSNDLQMFEQWAFGNGSRPVDYASIGEDDVRQWIMQRSLQRDNTTTLRRRLQSVRAFFRFLRKRGIVSSNPAHDVEMAKPRKRLPAYVREQNMDALLNTEVDTANYGEVMARTIVVMLYETGLRRAELIGLKDQNVDCSRMEMKVRGKRDKDRVVPFGNELKEWIERYKALRQREVGSGDGNFFLTAKGKPLYPSLIYRVVHENLLAAGGCSKQSPHVLRHSFATAMLNGGASINSVKEILGHESLAATQVYTHLAFGELKSNYQQAHPRAQKKEVL